MCITPVSSTIRRSYAELLLAHTEFITKVIIS
nr:MAG TPA: hypothetical protein [Bacteriophage sp.]